jgi:MFS family permease
MSRRAVKLHKSRIDQWLRHSPHPQYTGPLRLQTSNALGERAEFRRTIWASALRSRTAWLRGLGVGLVLSLAQMVILRAGRWSSNEQGVLIGVVGDALFTIAAAIFSSIASEAASRHRRDTVQRN